MLSVSPQQQLQPQSVKKRKTHRRRSNSSSSSCEDEATTSKTREAYNPHNRLVTRKWIEGVLSRLCGYAIRIGSLHHYQLAFVHKSVYRKDIAPPPEVVEQFLEHTGHDRVPESPPPPIGTYQPGGGKLIFTDTYEAMEFAGDGWIGCIIGQYVKSRFPRQSEGFYHNLKSYVVCKHGLSQLSGSLGFGEYALLSPQAEDMMTRKNDSLLEDIFEAFCCAVVEDLGVGVLRVAIKNLIESRIDFRSAIINDTNYKDVLKRVCKENGWKIPRYIDLGHNEKIGAQRQYSIGVEMINGAATFGVRGKSGFGVNGVGLCDLWSSGTGNTKKRAQQSAAHNALKALELALQYK